MTKLSLSQLSNRQKILAETCMTHNLELDMIIFDEAHKTVEARDKVFSYLLNICNIKTNMDHLKHKSS